LNSDEAKSCMYEVYSIASSQACYALCVPMMGCMLHRTQFQHLTAWCTSTAHVINPVEVEHHWVSMCFGFAGPK